MAKRNSKGHWLNGLGESIPQRYIPAIDKKRDAMVEKLMRSAEVVNERLVALRRLVDDEVAKFLAAAAAEHNLTPNEGGNYWFTSFSGDQRVEIKVGKFIDFDERLKWAKQKIDECLEKWSEGADDRLKLIVHDAFRADQKGRIDVKSILKLRKLKIEDDTWKEAMALIGQALTVTGSKTYVNFYRRGEGGQWQPIRLDIAAV